MAIESSRIAKNTIFLYIRMLITMLVALYTSKVLLTALGVVDFGLYNVVGGVVSMIAFLKGTIATTSSRFITVVIGKRDDEELKIVFSNLLLIILILSFVVVLISETVGLWFLLNKMTIPSERVVASWWVYNISVISIFFDLTTIPFLATIIAYERMKAFAYISFFDAIAKLIIAYLVTYSTYDRLIFYAILMLLMNMVHAMMYVGYCMCNFKMLRLRPKYEKSTTGRMLSFITWASYGSFVSVGFTQGLNILLNVFFGPAVNAARGVAMQVQNAVQNFTVNFQTALNPQLMKSVAEDSMKDARTLLVASSKYSFFLLCVLGFPLIVETPFILKLWLQNVPDYSAPFCRILLTTCIFGSLANPLRIINQAEGHIKRFQLIECTILLLIVPLSYCLLKVWQNPILVFLVQLTIEFFAQVARVWIVLPKVKMQVMTYLSDIYQKIIPVFVLPLAFAYMLRQCLHESMISSLVIIAIVEFSLLAVIYRLGLTQRERCYVLSKTKGYILRLIRII